MNGHRANARRVAVIGSGIAGMGAAWALATQGDSAGRPHVTLLEAEPRFGGHAHTVDLTLKGLTHGVDTGFLVFNHATYPNLVRLFNELAVPTAASEMTFSVQVPQSGLEWSGCNLDTVFAQRRNLMRPAFLRMLADLTRFNRITTAIAQRNEDAAMQQPLGQFLDAQGFGPAFRNWYLLPMLGCIWSCPADQMLQFPVATMIRFCHNHGLIRVSNRPQWYTVQGGSREYVRRLVAQLPDARCGVRVTGVRRMPAAHGAQSGAAGDAGVWVDTDAGSELFDEVVLAGHSPQCLALLGSEATAQERAVLGAIRTHRNRAVLHTDASLLPQRRKAWAAWNYERAGQLATEQSSVCLHYLINRLQPLPWQQPVIVSLNPVREPAAAQVHGEFDVAHPIFDAAAIAITRCSPPPRASNACGRPPHRCSRRRRRSACTRRVPGGRTPFTS